MLPAPVMFVGAYTDGDAEGIYSYRLDPETGALTEIGLAAESENPSFLALHPILDVLYAVNELDDYEGEESGAVTAFEIDYETGTLKRLNQVSTGGAHPAHLTVDRTGQWLFVANYTGGSIAVFPINDTGSLAPVSQLIRHVGTGTDPDRQAGPHPHSVTITEDNRYLYVSDLGLDRVYVYRFNAATGQLQPSIPAYVETAPGAGPRHLAFTPATNNFYGLNELDSTITAYRHDSQTGALEALGTLTTLPEGFDQQNLAAEVVATPRHVYASNRGHDSIAVFSVNADGSLTQESHTPTGGARPRNFALDPSGRFLYAANQNASNIVAFQVDPATGGLTRAGQVIEVPDPVSVVFAEATEPPAQESE